MCDTVCAACPRRIHAPQTAQGAAVWRLAQHHLGGQWRFAVVPGGMAGAASVPVGYDMQAALSVAGALGIDARAVAELLPVIEAAALQARQD